MKFLPFRTKNPPGNRWFPLVVREREVSTLSEKTIDEGEDFKSWCQHSSSRPSGRRGHSMTINAENQVYIFGGATVKCVCEEDEDGEKSCFNKNVYSDELWHFDPSTGMFTQLERSDPSAEWPRGREQHSATMLPNGEIAVIGGISSTDSSLEIGIDEHILSDIYVLRDPHHISPRTLRGSTHGVAGSARLPLQLIAGRVNSHVLAVPQAPSAADRVVDGDHCISDLTVRITMEHSCFNKGIEYIKLIGPTGDSMDYELKVEYEHCRSYAFKAIFL